MDSNEEDDIFRPEKLPIYLKGKEIFNTVSKIADLIPEKDEYLNEVKACMLSDAAPFFLPGNFLFSEFFSGRR